MSPDHAVRATHVVFRREGAVNKILAAVCVTVLVTGCQTTGTTIDPADEVDVSGKEMRDYLLSNSFSGTWAYGPEGLKGESRARFFERHGFLVASFKATDRDGSWGEFVDNIAEVSGNTVSFYYGGPFRLARTKDGIAGIQRYKNTYDVPYRLSAVGPAPRDVYALGDPAGLATEITTVSQFAEYLVDHSPFTGRWTWGEDRSGDAAMTIRRSTDTTVLIDLSTTRSNGERTQSRDNIGELTIVDGRPAFEYTTHGVTLRGALTNNGNITATRPFEERYAISFRLAPR
jgi:hypothetical protein